MTRKGALAGHEASARQKALAGKEVLARNFVRYFVWRGPAGALQSVVRECGGALCLPARCLARQFPAVYHVLPAIKRTMNPRLEPVC